MSKIVGLTKSLRAQRSEILWLMSLETEKLEEFLKLKKELSEEQYEEAIQMAAYEITAKQLLTDLQKELVPHMPVAITSGYGDNEPVIAHMTITPISVYINTRHNQSHTVLLRAEYDIPGQEKVSFEVAREIENHYFNHQYSWYSNRIVADFRSYYEWFKILLGDPDKGLTLTPDRVIENVGKIKNLLKMFGNTQQAYFKSYILSSCKFIEERYGVGTKVPDSYITLFKLCAEDVQSMMYQDTDGFIAITDTRNDKDKLLIITKKGDSYCRSNKNTKLHERYMFSKVLQK